MGARLAQTCTGTSARNEKRFKFPQVCERAAFSRSAACTTLLSETAPATQHVAGVLLVRCWCVALRVRPAMHQQGTSKCTSNAPAAHQQVHVNTSRYPRKHHAAIRELLQTACALLRFVLIFLVRVPRLACDRWCGFPCPCGVPALDLHQQRLKGTSGG